MFDEVHKTEINNEIGQSKFLYPNIPKNKRILPNDLIRSSLFTVGNHRVSREYIKEKVIFSFGNTRIMFTGEELRQDDADVWMQIIYQLAEQNDTSFDFLPYRLIKELNWPARSHYRDKLQTCLSRLSATNLTVYNKYYKSGISLSLVRKFQWCNDEGNRLKKWKIWVEPELVNLFSGMNFTKLIWMQRIKLTPLAKWLHSYYSSHLDPHSIKVETILKACGSKTKALKHFKPILRNALVELVQVGLLADYYINSNNLVCVTRNIKKQVYINEENRQ